MIGEPMSRARQKVDFREVFGVKSAGPPPLPMYLASLIEGAKRFGMGDLQGSRIETDVWGDQALILTFAHGDSLRHEMSLRTVLSLYGVKDRAEAYRGRGWVEALKLV